MLRHIFQHFTRPVSRELCENWALLDQDRLVNYARAHLGSSADAELVISKAMHRVMRALYAGSINKEELLPYACTTIRNMAATLYRKEAHRREAEGRYAEAEELRACPASAAGNRQAQELDLHQALRQLPDELAAIVIQHIWEGRSFADIAAGRGLSESTARRKYREALALIRHGLTP